jgi:hypothetical protein
MLQHGHAKAQQVLFPLEVNVIHDHYLHGISVGDNNQISVVIAIILPYLAQFEHWSVHGQAQGIKPRTHGVAAKGVPDHTASLQKNCKWS